MSATKDAVIGLLNSSLKDRDDRVDILRTIISDNDKTISTMSNHMEVMREQVTSYSRDVTNLKKVLDTKDAVISDLNKSIKEQCNNLKDLRNLLAEYRNLCK
jgi:chromosome segregation ATPase